MSESYLEQLEKIAEETGWNLKEACYDAGIAETTLYRWKGGKTSPSHKTALKLAEYMATYRT